VNAPGVLYNDSDADAGQTITAMLVTGPQHASAFSLNPDGSFTYTPALGFTGTDSFTYQATDGIFPGNTVTVTIEVLAPTPALASGWCAHTRLSRPRPGSHTGGKTRRRVAVSPTTLRAPHPAGRLLLRLLGRSDFPRRRQLHVSSAERANANRKSTRLNSSHGS